jgi:hypothetical protein
VRDSIKKASVLSGILPRRICAEPWVLSVGCRDQGADMHAHPHPHVRAEFPREQLSATRMVRRGRSSCCTLPGRANADSAWYTHVSTSSHTHSSPVVCVWSSATQLLYGPLVVDGVPSLQRDPVAILIMLLLGLVGPWKEEAAATPIVFPWW